MKILGDYVDIELNVDEYGEVLIEHDDQYLSIDREQAAQLAEVLKRYSETGRIDE